MTLEALGDLRVGYLGPPGALLLAGVHQLVAPAMPAPATGPIRRTLPCSRGRPLTA